MSNAMQKQGPQALKVTPVDKMMLNLMGEMSKREARLENLLPPDMPVERFKESVRFALAQNQDLLNCDPGTVLLSVMKAAKLGIDLTGALGHGYLVPYGADCTFVPGYKGLAMLAIVAGVVRDMTPVLVYDRDEFVPEEGDAPRLLHKPYVPRKAADSRGDIIAAYTRVLLPDGSRVIKGLLYADDIARIEAGIRAKKSPWNTAHRPEMVKKSSVKNAFKTLGVPSTEQTARLREAMDADVEADARETSEPATHSLTPEPEKATDRLKAHVRAKAPPQEAQQEPPPSDEPPPGMALGEEPGEEG